MRRWGRVPICKDSRPYHDLGFQNHTTLMRKARKEVFLGTEEDLQGSKIEKKNLQKTREHGFDSRVERKDDKQACFGCKNPWVGSRYKMINEDDE
jgi:hypothetical protein